MKKRKTMKEKVEERINKCKSFVDLIAYMVIIVICSLGIITLMSAITQIVIECRTCLDEKFNMVTYTVGLDLKNKQKDDVIDYHMKNFEIGKYGFNAILRVENDEVKQVTLSNEKLEKNHTVELMQKLNSREVLERIRNSKLPFLFTKSGFKDTAPYMWVGNNLYKYRVSRTSIEGIYILSASGQDEYLFKIIRILVSAMLVTIIAVPVFIYYTRRWLSIIKEQLLDLEKQIRNLETDDITTKPLTKVVHSKNEIGKIAEAITSLTKNLDEKANIDQLTGIKNKRYLNNYLLKLEKDKKLDSIGVILLDIDHFKYYNDTYGHLEGDIVLRQVAKSLEKIAGKKNTVARFGGEEFVVVSRNITIKELEKLCDNLVVGIRNLKIEHKSSPVEPFLTISVGGAINTSSKFSSIAVIEKADKAVYKAKETGRNKYVIDKSFK